MKEFLAIYALLPIVYFIYRAGELASERGYSPIRWRLRAYITVVFGGVAVTLLTVMVSMLAGFKFQNKTLLFLALGILYLIGVLTAGYTLLSLLKQRKPIASDKRTYRTYDLKNAFLFPRVIPRGGFLWRAFSYTILMSLLQKLLEFAFLPLGSAILSFFWFVISIGISCFALLYFITYICVARIRDAGLSRDTLVMLFIPALNLVALLMLFATPTRASGRSSI